MPKLLTLTAVVQKSTRKGGWHYILLPHDVLIELHTQAGKNGNLPVLAKTGKTSWKSTVMSRGNQQWYLPLAMFVRQAEAIQEGDSISVNLVPDHNKLKIYKKS